MNEFVEDGILPIILPIPATKGVGNEHFRRF